MHVPIVPLFLLLTFTLPNLIHCLQYRNRWNFTALDARLRTERPPPPECECSPLSFDSEVPAAVFKSPLFPRSYCDDLDCVYEIEPRAGMAVVLTVEYFETEELHDYVEIYQMMFGNASADGGGATLVKHMMLSGSSIHQQHFLSTLGGGIRVRFVTDTSMSNFAGFQMSFYRFAANSRRHRPCPQPFLTASRDWQSVPQMDSHFYRNSTCIFQINSTKAVELQVNSLYYPYLLRIYEAQNYYPSRKALRSLELEALLGDIQSPVANLATSSQATVEPKPRYVVRSRTSSLLLLMGFAPPGRGISHPQSLQPYEIRFTAVESPCACPSTSVELQSTVGANTTFLSPGYPLEYCDNHNCTTAVSIRSRNRSSGRQNTAGTTGERLIVRVRFEAFQLESDVDWLELVATDSSGKSSSMVNLSDDARGLAYFTFDTPQCALHFVTDRTIAEPGFNLTLETASKPVRCLCPGSPKLLIEELRALINVHFEGRCRWMDCFWIIRLPERAKIQSSTPRDSRAPSSIPTVAHRILIQVNWVLAAEDEWLEIAYGEDVRGNRQRIRLDGTMMTDNDESVLPASQQSLGDQWMVNGTRHISFDHEEQDTSITVWYHRQGDETQLDTTRSIDLRYEWRERCVCGEKELVAKLSEWRPLTSPEYPLEYCNNLFCDYVIRAEDEEQFIVFNVTDFITEAHHDYLLFFEGNSTRRQHSNVLSGMPIGTVIRSTGNVMSLLFSTDMSISYRGFVLYYKAEPQLLPSGRRGSSSAGPFNSSSLAIRFVFVALAVVGIGLVIFYVRSHHNGLLDGATRGYAQVRDTLANRFGTGGGGDGGEGAIFSVRYVVQRCRGGGRSGVHLAGSSSLSNPLFHDDMSGLSRARGIVRQA